MTSSSAACREIRQLLGVYVVGAIDPAERAIVDDHVSQCQACRNELAGMAGLPAMLGRVPATEAERLDLPPAEPAPELLNSLLAKVSARRRRRVRRVLTAVAAGVAIAAGITFGATELTGAPARPASAQQVASGSSASNQVAAVVDYTPSAFGTAMRVQVTGISPGTTCQFWVLGANGWTSAGGWTVRADYGQNQWYPASSLVPPSSVRGFRITSAGQVLLTIPVR